MANVELLIIFLREKYITAMTTKITAMTTETMLLTKRRQELQHNLERFGDRIPPSSAQMGEALSTKPSLD